VTLPYSGRATSITTPKPDVFNIRSWLFEHVHGIETDRSFFHRSPLLPHVYLVSTPLGFVLLRLVMDRLFSSVSYLTSLLYHLLGRTVLSVQLVERMCCDLMQPLKETSRFQHLGRVDTQTDAVVECTIVINGLIYSGFQIFYVHAFTYRSTYSSISIWSNSFAFWAKAISLST
jgi:hypothetical protein